MTFLRGGAKFEVTPLLTTSCVLCSLPQKVYYSVHAPSPRPEKGGFTRPRSVAEFTAVRYVSSAFSMPQFGVDIMVLVGAKAGPWRTRH